MNHIFRIGVNATVLGLALLSTMNTRGSNLLPVLALSGPDNGNEQRFHLLEKTIQKQLPAFKNIHPVFVKIGEGEKKETIKDEKKEFESNGFEKQLESLNKAIMELTTTFKTPFILYAAGDDGLYAFSWIAKYSSMFKNKRGFFPVKALVVTHSILNGFFTQPGKKTHLDALKNKVIETYLEEECKKIYEYNLKKCLQLIFATKKEKSQNEGSWFSFNTLKSACSKICTNTIDTLANYTPETLKKYTPDFLFSRMSDIFYSKEMQESYSPAAYWNDPTKQEAFLKSALLARYLNLTPHDNTTLYATNISKVKYITCISSPNDHIVKPWYSGLFLDKEPKDLNKLEDAFKETEQYKKNLLGLKTLLDNQRLALVAILSGHECHYHEKVCQEIAQAVVKAQKTWLAKYPG